ncbi:hypothetical protein [Jiangella alba]|uniref:Uncharacterized protein n=1 Tax=Jiangella alba TaxID=561176 RepID=A0A1H5H021_9ACTN|nr:hypothetical protein [Jiangella alba]SEE21297.1 hypothetical protein SAMN04488561_0712 [Jiangella alba]
MSVRNDYDRKTAGLAGVRVEGVEYWDMRDVEPREWDHGDWHHAVMGVELTTDAGPVSVVCTNTFHPYGVEIFDEPLSKLVVRGDDGPGNWTVTDHPAWRSRTDQPILAAGTFWERLGFGPGRYSDGSIATPARTVEVPVALRLDFAAGPLWFVAGNPSETGEVFIPGDEIMVVFTPEEMLRIGFPAVAF